MSENEALHRISEEILKAPVTCEDGRSHYIDESNRRYLASEILRVQSEQGVKRIRPSRLEKVQPEGEHLREEIWFICQDIRTEGLSETEATDKIVALIQPIIDKAV